MLLFLSKQGSGGLISPFHHRAIIKLQIQIQGQDERFLNLQYEQQHRLISMIVLIVIAEINLCLRVIGHTCIAKTVRTTV